jgi:hypothetical protein
LAKGCTANGRALAKVPAPFVRNVRHRKQDFAEKGKYD